MRIRRRFLRGLLLALLAGLFASPLRAGENLGFEELDRVLARYQLRRDAGPMKPGDADLILLDARESIFKINGNGIEVRHVIRKVFRDIEQDRSIELEAEPDDDLAVVARIHLPGGKIESLRGSDFHRSEFRTLASGRTRGYLKIRFKFPLVAPGAILEYRMIRKQTLAERVGFELFAEDAPILLGRFDLVVPREVPMRLRAMDPARGEPLAIETLEEVDVDKSRIRRSVIRLSGLRPPSAEPFAAGVPREFPWILYHGDPGGAPEDSVFHPIGLARLLGEIYRTLARPTPPIRHLADRVFGPETDPGRQLALAVAFASRTVRGDSDDGDVTSPIAPEEAIETELGGSPERALIVSTLIACRGQASEFVFVNSRRNFAIEADFCVPSAFDTVLLAVRPSSGDARLVNTADPDLPPHRIPWYCQGAVALTGGREVSFGGHRMPAAGLFRTPIDAPSQNRVSRRIELTLADDGSLSGSWRIELEGSWATTVESELQSLPVDLARFSGRWVALASLPATTSEPKVTREAGRLQLSGTLSVASLAPGGAGTVVFPALLPADFFLDTFQPHERRHAFDFRTAFELRDTVTIALPKGWGTTALPPAVTGTAPPVGWSWRSRIEAGAGRLAWTREFDMASLDAPASFHESARRFADEVTLAEMTAVVVGPTGAPARSTSAPAKGRKKPRG